MRKLTFFNLFLLLILCPLSMSVGVADFHWGELFSQSEQSQLFFISRLPRTLAVILVGATLSVAGMVLQIVLKNRFIEPSMIGASQSAAVFQPKPPPKKNEVEAAFCSLPFSSFCTGF